MLHLISVRQKLVYKTTLALQWLFISIISFHNGFCQNQNTTNTLQNYQYDIVKLSIYREDLNEVNISDAVILDPVSRAIEIKTDTISLDLHNGSSLHITLN